jgi:deoxyribodipyrimidine photolyase-related protein
MSSESFFLFPVHLFSNVENLKDKKVFLIEDHRYFTDFKYHKLKIAYHRATMKSYYDFLKSKHINVEYIDLADTDKFYKKYKKGGKHDIFTYDLGDDTLKKRLIKQFGSNLVFQQTLNFLVNEEMIREEFKDKVINHNIFYKWQRIRLNILIEKGDKPVGGKWSFDEENRKKLPKNVAIPHVISLKAKSPYIEEAIEYTEKNFADNYGSLDNFIYPINHEDSKKWLVHFLKNKFKDFGPYEDAESMRDPFLFHSVLTPMMNVGLLTDSEVLEITLPYQNKVSLASFEGFIRQIIGWRNYIYTIYLLKGDSLSKSNFFKHTNRLNKKHLWGENSGILPIDNIIKKISDYSYAHHIERLMYLGNFMLICMVNPKDVYEIFMEWTIDAYEWVMVPNVFGMSQFADGGDMMTRPYFSSSNYILKMSDYKKGKWCKTFDALYYNFINHHQKYLSSNYATSRQVAHWVKKDNKSKQEIIQISKKYLESNPIFIVTD